MSPLKCPGPDGMPPLFYQKFWHVIRSDVINCVLHVLNSGTLLHKMNFTHIVLIPKRSDPETVAHFCPISLCNTIVKIASKCIANRLKPILDMVISPAQSAFIPGRLITDNVMVAFEINHFVKQRTRGKAGHFALKLDMSKTYDRVEWNFLRAMMCLNGGCVRATPCHRTCSYLLQEAERRGEIRGISISREAARISHLLFADDTIIFGQVGEGAMLTIRRILSRFGEASGQEVNFEKSSMVVSRNIRSKQDGGLGFREMKAFNRALLAKQGWRLLKKPLSLLSQIMRAKYYKEQSFWDAQLGSLPSLTWRSIFEVRDLLLSGCRLGSPDVIIW
ncbi:UNVERIFIED_CONTAM: putative mitochondrial protein [Sesamum radiatum]|uniref:Mitochondrial protein n=1 Tax=Sesamum radiatum TaxID=300843 RepID=A0AAW2QHC9_SESRA